MLFLKIRNRFLGNDLLFHPVTRQVPSALEGLTAGFEMGPGVPPPLISPRKPVLLMLAYTFKTEQNAVLAIASSTIKPSIISTALLKTLLPVHMPPINLVVFQGSYLLAQWVISS